MSVTAQRPATSQDHTRLAAQRLYAEGDAYRQKPDFDSRSKARNAYRQALTKWVEAGDRPRQAVTLRQISALSGRLSLGQQALDEGAARVLASLWEVDDQKTASLMKAFYTRLLDEDGRMRMTPAAALRQAQIRSKLNNAPFHWAGFVLQGEYK